jgi:hypothetical protein
MKAFRRQGVKGLYLWGFYQEKEEAAYDYFYFLKITGDDFRVLNKECIKRRADKWLDTQGMRVDFESVFVTMSEEVLLAIRAWYLERLPQINELFYVRKNNSSFIH